RTVGRKVPDSWNSAFPQSLAPLRCPAAVCPTRRVSAQCLCSLWVLAVSAQDDSQRQVETASGTLKTLRKFSPQIPTQKKNTILFFASLRLCESNVFSPIGILGEHRSEK